MSLSDIKVTVEAEDYYTGNVSPLLHEISHAVEGLLENGEEHVIDLRGIPMAPGEEARIEELLGRGEVDVQLDALGESRIIETRFPGVWLITHYNSQQEIMGKFIEIARIPGILAAQEEDIRDGLGALRKTLDEES